MKAFVFKPDGIGDFVLATGAIHKLAETCGEENLMICVRSFVGPLARAQFPKAHILELPQLDRRIFLNLFIANFLRALKPWARLLSRRFESAVSLRYMRDYLHTFMFFSTRAARFLTCENLLQKNKKNKRHKVEQTITAFRHAEIVPYPEIGSHVPLELEAHRRVLSALFKQEIPIVELLPRLHANPHPGDYWLCSPFSTLLIKDYPAAKWAEVFRSIPADIRPSQIRITGSASQTAQMQALVDLLKADGFADTQVYVGKDLQDFVDCIAGAKMVLTIDTAAAHIAAALDRPSVILHSGLHLGMFGPWKRSERQFWFEADPRAKQHWHKAISPESVAIQATTCFKKFQS